MTTPTRPRRRDFLKTLSCAAGCTALLPLLPGCTVVELYGGSGEDIELDLATPEFKALAELEGIVSVDTGARKLILIRNAEDSIIALDRICPHTSCDMKPEVAGVWDQENQQLICRCHTSVFAVDGSLIAGPSPRGVTAYPVEFDKAAGTGLVRLSGGADAGATE